MSKENLINNVQTFDIQGPWSTKSQGSLDVLSALTHSQLKSFLSYDINELSKINEDIRGLRIYRVANLKKGAVGGNEWHRVKQELVFVSKGRVLWTLEDREGQKMELTLSPRSCGILIPTNILHTYTSLENDSEIIVITNTLYNVDNPATHDTYSPDLF